MTPSEAAGKVASAMAAKARADRQTWRCQDGHELVSWVGDPVCWYCGKEVGPK